MLILGMAGSHSAIIGPERMVSFPSQMARATTHGSMDVCLVSLWRQVWGKLTWRASMPTETSWPKLLTNLAADRKTQRDNGRGYCRKRNHFS